MITNDDINTILRIKESYQLHNTLKNILFDQDKKIETFERFLAIENDLSYDWFTNYFQENQSNRKSFMQDYTPDCICKIISGLMKDSNVILDCCSGIGGLTISVPDKKNKIFYCEELSNNSVMMLLFNLSIRNIQAYVRHGDVLTNEFNRVYKLIPGERFSDIEEITQANDYVVDTVISNPPYSLKFDKVDDYEDDIRFKEYGVPPKAKADYAFVLHALSKLKENGEAFFILPHGILFRGAKEGNIRKKLIENKMIDTVIGLPDKLFLNTDIPVCILVLKKNRRNDDILFIDASKLFEKHGKNNLMTTDHINKLISIYRLRADVDKLSHLASLEEIRDNDYNLNIPRYVDNFEKQEPIDMKKNLEELKNIETEISKTEQNLTRMLKEITGPIDYNSYRDGLVEMLEKDKEDPLIKMCNATNDFVNKNIDMFKKQKQINLLDLVEFERSKKDKIYQSGCILIQVSATRGQLEYLENSSTVDSKFGVFIPKWNVNPKYLYYVLEMLMPGFLARYQTGLNINPEIFKHLILTIHTDVNVQALIVKMLDSLQVGIENEEKTIKEWKNVKQVHLDGMFI